MCYFSGHSHLHHTQPSIWTESGKMGASTMTTEGRTKVVSFLYPRITTGSIVVWASCILTWTSDWLLPVRIGWDFRALIHPEINLVRHSASHQPDVNRQRFAFLDTGHSLLHKNISASYNCFCLPLIVTLIYKISHLPHSNANWTAPKTSAETRE